jgi:succinate-semialdehyde dehydrogenase/glutarate-semialdehyde dehydrogenase
MGKLVAQAEWEVNLSADILDYYADNGEAFLADKNLNPESEAIIRNSPIGVLFGVMPWNFPFIR